MWRNQPKIEVYSFDEIQGPLRSQMPFVCQLILLLTFPEKVQFRHLTINFEVWI